MLRYVTLKKKNKPTDQNLQLFYLMKVINLNNVYKKNILGFVLGKIHSYYESKIAS